MKRNLSSRNIINLFLKLLPIQIFIQISSSLSSLINGSIVGNSLSAADMSALGLITPYLTAIGAIASIFSGGVGIICGNLMGKGDKDKIDTIYSVSVNISIVSGLIIMLASFVLRKPLANLFGANSEMLNNTISYLTGICLGVMPMLLLPSLMTFLQMSNESNFSLIATILLAVFNAILDLFCIGILKNGVFGIGLASSISYYLTSLVVLFFIRHKKLVKYNLHAFGLNDIKQIIVFGAPFALATFLYAVRNIYINNLSSSIGGLVAVNALAILSSFDGFQGSFNVGIGSTYRMLASVYVGERDEKSLKELFKHGFIISEIIIIIKIILMISLAKPIAIAFGASGETINMTVRLITYYAMASPFNILVIYMLSTHLTMGKSGFCNIMYLISAFIAPITYCYFMSKIIGLDGIFSCYYIAEIITIICIFIYAFIKNKKLKLTFEELFNLPKDFDEGNKLEISIDNIEQVVNTSEAIEKFCKKENIDPKISKYAGLCAEEMAGNIVEHGFNKDKKKHSIDIFVLVENNEVLMRIKDDCIGFDPNTRASIYNPEDPSKNVGIRLVSKLAKTMNYQSTFGMNVLTITI